MDKLVYLHELDSVRNSADEMEAARRALYQEIVCNGNTVVITMNQLADSRAFLGLVAEDDGMLTAIKGLMLNGAIKISRYGDKRTASQYLQDNLQPTPAGSHGKFVLSGWDIPDELDIEERESIRDHIYRALRNSDTAYLELKKRAPGDDLSSLYNENAAITVQRYNDALDIRRRQCSPLPPLRWLSGQGHRSGGAASLKWSQQPAPESARTASSVRTEEPLPLLPDAPEGRWT